MFTVGKLIFERIANETVGRFCIQSVRNIYKSLPFSNVTISKISSENANFSCIIKVPFRLITSAPKAESAKKWYTVTFAKGNSDKFTVQGKDGDNLLDIANNNNIDLEGFGACEGTLACSTCHLVFERKDYDKIPTPPSDEELDMLDLAYGLTETSRLGCQVCLTQELDGLEVRVPEAKADARIRD